MSSHEDCTADNVDESIDNILDLPDGFEAEMLPDDSQVRSVNADEPDGESGVAGRPTDPTSRLYLTAMSDVSSPGILTCQVLKK